MAAASADYEIRRATVADQEQCFQLLKRAFFPDEPIQVSMNERGPETKDEVNCLKYIEENTSFLAVNRGTRGQEVILGMCLNGEQTTQLLQKRETMLTEGETRNETQKKLTKLFILAIKEVNIWEKYGTDTGFGINMVVVDKLARGCGIGKTLMETSLRLAEELKYKLVYVECTSFYSARLCEQLGMTCELTIPYAEYKDGGCDPVFIPPPPHKHFKTFIKQINI